MSETGVLLFSLVAGMSTVVGVYLVKLFSVWTKRNSILMISFAGGVLVATGFLELLPEASSLNNNWAAITMIGVLALFILEHFMAIHECQDEECDVHGSGKISALGIGIHSLIDGLVIGTGFQAGTAIGIIAAFAVIVHEVPEGVFTYGLLIAGGEPEKRALLIGWIVALATPAGTLITYLALRGLGGDILGIMLAFAAGTFIYVGVADLLPQIHKKSDYKAMAVMLLGVGFVMGVRYLFG